MSFRFPVYQVDFSAVAAGKRVAATKRRIRWRFGFPNQRALEEGKTGNDCRGEEHEIVVVWSVTSGKRQILMDGREINYSSNRVGIIDYTWSTKGNHVLKIVCHATAPLSANPGFRQYDLFIDGQTFFHMPKMYELGIRGGSADDQRIPGIPASYGGSAMVSPRSVYSESAYGGGRSAGFESTPPVKAPRNTAEEDEELKRAIQASLAESKTYLNGPAPDVLDAQSAGVDNADLLDFGSSVPSPHDTSAPQSITGQGNYGAPLQQQYGAVPPPSPAYGAPPSQYLSYAAAPQPQQQQYLALPPPPPAYGSQPPTPSFARPVPPSPAYSVPPAQAPPPQGNQFAPQPAYGAPPTQAPPPQQNRFAPQPSYGVANGLHGMDDPFAPRAPRPEDVANNILKAYGGGETPTSGYNGYSPQGRYQPGQPFFQETAQYGGGTPYTNGSAPGLNMNGLAITEGEDKPENPFDAALKKLVNVDHIDEPAEEKLKLTMKKQEEELAKKNKHKSVPLPPAASRVVGSGAILSQISQVKPPPKMECVMTPPPGLFQGDAAGAGAMVVYGQGPPPLQPSGFGVVHMQGRYPQTGYGYR